jgi:hypothetical protein
MFLTFLPNDGSYRRPFVSIIKNLIRDNEWELLGKVLAITDVTARWREFQTRCLF